MSFNTESRENTGGGICGVLYIIKGMLFSFIFSLLLILPSSLICMAFFPKDRGIFTAVCIIYFLSTLFSGFYMSRHVVKSGLLNGALSGVLYSLILFLIGSLVSGGVSFSPISAALFVISLLGGAFGGILGINSVKTSRRR